MERQNNKIKNWTEKDKVNLGKMTKSEKCQLLMAMSYTDYNCKESFGSKDSHQQLDRKILKGFKIYN